MQGLEYNCASALSSHSSGQSKPDLFWGAWYNLAAIFTNGYTSLFAFIPGQRHKKRLSLSQVFDFKVKDGQTI